MELLPKAIEERRQRVEERGQQPECELGSDLSQ